MKIKYVNHLGEEINLSRPPLMLEPVNAYNYAWSYEATESQKNGIKIGNFYRSKKEASMPMFIRGVDANGRGNLEAFNQALRLFFETTEKDIIAREPGRLVLSNGEYMTCYIVEISHSNFAPRYRLDQREIKIVSPYPFWITEATKHFQPVGREEIEGEFLDYPYDYSYDYSYETPGIRIWNLDHYATSEFKMTIYGYCENPRILITGYPYQIFGTVEENEFLVIDSKNKTVTHYLNNGTTENWFDFRNKENSVFEPLPSGNLTVTWDGTYGFDILAYLERSEPRWT